MRSSPNGEHYYPHLQSGVARHSLIQNCLDQSYSQIEIVVVDDGSTDDTAARLATFGDQIKLIRQSNRGVSAARNAAVLAATGELLQFLDSDNLLHDQHVEAKVGAFASIPDADLCYCSATEVSLFGVKPFLHHSYTVRECDTSPMVDLLDFIVADGFSFPVSSVTMPRHTFLHNGRFDTDLQRAEDSRYWFRLALAGVKVIALTRRLFYRCRMTDGLNETRHVDETASIIVLLRDVVDLLRRPEQWPAVAEYLSRKLGQWTRLLDRGLAYGRDFDILLQTIAGALSSAGHSSNRSPLPLLVFLWTLGERHRSPQGTLRFGQAALRDLLANTLLAAMVGAEPLGQVDKIDWVCHAPKLRAKRIFARDIVGRDNLDALEQGRTQARRNGRLSPEGRWRRWRPKRGCACRGAAGKADAETQSNDRGADSRRSVRRRGNYCLLFGSDGRGPDRDPCSRQG